MVRYCPACGMICNADAIRCGHAERTVLVPLEVARQARFGLFRAQVCIVGPGFFTTPVPGVDSEAAPE